MPKNRMMGCRIRENEMSLFVIGDLHLHFQSELKAPGQLWEPVWKKEESKKNRRESIL